MESNPPAAKISVLFRGPSGTEKHSGVKLILDQHMGQHHISYLLYYCSPFSVENEYISGQNNFHYKTNDSSLFDIYQKTTSCHLIYIIIHLVLVLKMKLTS